MQCSVRGTWSSRGRCAVETSKATWDLKISRFCSTFLGGNLMAVRPKYGSQQPDSFDYFDRCGAAMRSAAPAAPQLPVKAEPGTTIIATNCPTCGTQVMRGAAFYDGCSAALSTLPLLPPIASPQQPGMLIGPHCDTQLGPSSNFCDMCSTPIGALHGRPCRPNLGQTHSRGFFLQRIIRIGRLRYGASGGISVVRRRQDGPGRR